MGLPANDAPRDGREEAGRNSRRKAAGVGHEPSADFPAEDNTRAPRGDRSTHTSENDVRREEAAARGRRGQTLPARRRSGRTRLLNTRFSCASCEPVSQARERNRCLIRLSARVRGNAPSFIVFPSECTEDAKLRAVPPVVKRSSRVRSVHVSLRAHPSVCRRGIVLCPCRTHVSHQIFPPSRPYISSFCPATVGRV